jgi:hypothetical protein
LWRYALRESVIRADATDAEVMMLSK